MNWYLSEVFEYINGTLRNWHVPKKYQKSACGDSPSHSAFVDFLRGESKDQILQADFTYTKNSST
jgi:hypothetical protein